MQILLHKRTFYFIVFIAVNFLLLGTAFGQTVTKTWDGGGSSLNWEDANNWSPDGVPTASDNVVIIPNVSVNINYVNNVCASLQLNNGSSGNNESKLIFKQGGQLNVIDEIIIGKTGSRRGSIDMNAGGRLICGKMTVNKFQSWIPGTGTVEFTSENNTLSSELTSFNNLILSNTSNIELTSNVTISGTLTVNGILNFGTNQSGLSNTVNGAGNFILSSTGTLAISSTSGIDGNITTTGKTFPANGASYIFNGPTTTPFASIMASPVSVSNLSIGNNVTLNKNVNISGVLTLNSGLLTIPTTKKLTLTSPNAVVGSGFGSSKHIVTEVNKSSREMGVFQVNGVVNTFELPIGDGTHYLPATVTPASPSDFNVTVFTGITADGKPGTALEPAQRTNMVNAVWDITGTYDIATTISVGWPKNQNLEGASFLSAIQNSPNSIGISHYTDGKWDAATGVFDPNSDPNTNMITRSGISSFSPFAAFLMSEEILPVHFSNVRATEKSSGVQVEFTNLTESDVDYYEVERSSDGKAFSSVKKIYPTKNNYGSAAYSWLDGTAKSGRNIYRIKAVETTRKTVYSNLVSITLGGSGTNLNVYAKGGEVMLQMNSLPAGKYQLQLFNAAGQLLSIEHFSHAGGSLSQTKSLNIAKSGVYILNINGGIQLQKKFLVQ